MASIERANSHKKVTWVSIFGLITIPALIAGGLLWANWNPQERFHKVDAAIVNLDEAVELNGSPVLLGRQLAAGLMDTSADTSDSNYTWHLETAEGAASGIADGTYVASITIPKDFSAAATSFSGTASKAKQATLEVTTSSVTALADATVAQAISQTAMSTLNATLTTSYLDNIYVGFNTLSTKLSEMGDGASQLASAGTQLDDGTQSLASGLASAGDGATTLASGASTLASGADSLADGTDQLAAGAEKLKSATSSLSSSAKSLTDGGAALKTGASSLSDGVSSYTEAISGTSKTPGLADAASGLKQALDGTISGITAQAQSCPTDVSDAGATSATQIARGAEQALADQGVALTPDQLTALEAYATSTQITEGGGALTCGIYQSTLGGAAAALSDDLPQTQYSLSGLAGQLSSGLDQLSKAATQKGGLNDGASSLSSGVASYVGGINTLAKSLPSLSSGIASLAEGASGVNDGAASLASGTGSLASGVSGLADGVTSAGTGAEKLADGTSKLNDGLDKFSTGVAEGASGVPTYSESDRDTLSKVVVAPVTTTGTDGQTVFSAYPAAGLLIMVSLWIGAIATFLVVRPVTRRAVQSSKSSLALLAQGLWPSAVTSVGATALLTAIAASVLGLPASTIFALAVFSLAASLVFSVVNYALVAAFGGTGRFISIAMVVLGSATLLISGSPGFFDTAALLSPLTPAFRGFTAIAANGAGIGTAIGGLVVWLVIGIALAFVAVSTRRQARPAVLDTI